MCYSRCVTEKVSIISEALLLENVMETHDGIYNYARVHASSAIVLPWHLSSQMPGQKGIWQQLGYADAGRYSCYMHFQSNGRTKYA